MESSDSDLEELWSVWMYCASWFHSALSARMWRTLENCGAVAIVLPFL